MFDGCKDATFDRRIRRLFAGRHTVIASEVGTVIDALVSRSISRSDLLKSLDKFYKAIENAAETIEAFEDRQHFLNTVYGRFFQGYSVKVADTDQIPTGNAVKDYPSGIARELKF